MRRCVALPRIRGGLQRTVQLGSRQIWIGTFDGVISPALGGILMGHGLRVRLIRRACLPKADEFSDARRFSLRPGPALCGGRRCHLRRARAERSISSRQRADVAAVLVLVDRSAGQARFDYRLLAGTDGAGDGSLAACPMCARNEPFMYTPVHKGYQPEKPVASCRQ